MANDMGPARSPIALFTPSPFSAKVDAHWLTPCSLAPAHTIISINIQKSLFLNKSRILIPVSPSAISEAIGTLINAILFIIGTSAQMTASIFQFSIPAILKKIVEIKTTPTCPQQ